MRLTWNCSVPTGVNCWNTSLKNPESVNTIDELRSPDPPFDEVAAPTPATLSLLTVTVLLPSNDPLPSLN
ncbi:MAG TPA: hypothetical protein VGZ73_08370 [Bryobacteraceae bacterium]|nr:hypothetical protein [Bryobacteraceae bacterium]